MMKKTFIIFCTGIACLLTVPATSSVEKKAPDNSVYTKNYIPFTQAARAAQVRAKQMLSGTFFTDDFLPLTGGTVTGVLRTNHATAADNSADFENTSSSGYGLYTRGGSASRYALSVNNYDGTNYFTVMGGTGATSIKGATDITYAGAALTMNGSSGNSGAYMYLQGNANTYKNWGIGNDATGYLKFSVSASAGGTDYSGSVFKISESGNVTASGSITAGGATFDGTVNSSAGSAAFNNTYSGSNGSWLNMQNAGGVTYFGRDNSSGTDFGTTAYASVLVSTGAYPLHIKTNNTTRLTVSSGGNLGIGTTSPSAKLEVYNPSAGYIAKYNNAGGYAFNAYQINGDDKAYIQWHINDAGSAAGSSMIVNNVEGKLHLMDNTNTGISISGGNVGIGTTSPASKLSVVGNSAFTGNISTNGFITTKKLTVTQLGWSDYVFNKDYKLRSLSSLESFIKQNKHLPEIPSAKEVQEKGISVGDNQALLLKKIEELTLYIIELKKENIEQNKKIQKLANKKK